MSKGNRHRRERREQPAEQHEGLWVISDVMPDGTYAVTISINGDTSWVLDPPGAVEYARTCVEAAQRAEYDAAIYKLFTRKLGLDHDSTVQMIGHDIRPDRPPLNDAATAPLRFVPGVNAKGEGFMAIWLKDTQVGQLDPADLREHAMVVLEAPGAVDLDAGLLRALLTMDIEEPIARAAVGDIANWREN